MTDSPRPLNRFEEWAAKRASTILAVAAVAAVIGAGIMVWLLIDEQRRFAGVERAGPCRSQGIDDAECREQARLIFKACSDQPARCARLYGIRIMPWLEDRREVAKGVVAQPPPQAVQQPRPEQPSGRPAPSKPRTPVRKQPRRPVPAPQPAPVAAPVAPSPAPLPGPGSSGDTPAPDKGVKACVDLIVSACVKAP